MVLKRSSIVVYANFKSFLGNHHMVEKIIERALTSLSSNGVEINREHWFKEAIESEKGGHVHCCRAIVKAIISHGVEPEDQKHTWMEDADNVCYKIIAKIIMIIAYFVFSVLIKALMSVHVQFTIMLFPLSQAKNQFG